ncbi:MAG: hypothetical protein ACK4WM_02740 [Thermoflexales bacterium]
MHIVLVGAGSASFGPSLLGDLFLNAEHLRNSRVCLVDVDEQALHLMARYATRLNRAFGEPFRLEATTDHREVLPGAHVVFVSVAVNRLETWKLDWQIPLRHGVRHVLGENGGPGGLSHALRNIPLVLQIARDVQRLAPQALLINFTNPLSRVCMALDRYTQVQFVGLSHHIAHGYALVNQVLQLVPTPAQRHLPDRATLAAIRSRLRLRAAGLNHFSFILEMRDPHTGEDLYPRFRTALAQMPPNFELMSRRLMDVFGLFCASGDLHAGEYISFAAETQPLCGFDFRTHEAHRARLRETLQQLADEPDDARARQHVQPSIEHAVDVALGWLGLAEQSEDALNLRNNGRIAHLPAEAIVETPGRVIHNQLIGEAIGDMLPRGLAAIMHREVEIQSLVVEAAVKGDRNAALQALLLDPHIHSYAQATHLLEDLLRAQAAYLPQFA